MMSKTDKVKQEFAKRLHHAMDIKGYPMRGRARVLSKEFQISDKGAGKWLNGEAIPETSKIPLLAQFLNTNAEWLLSGGEALDTEKVTAHIDGIPMSSVEMITVEGWDSHTPLDDDEIEIPFYKDFALACGGGSIQEALASERRRLRLSKLTLNNEGVIQPVAMSAMGHSMSPTIKDKSTVYVDIGQKNVIDGRIYAVCHGGLFRFKYLYKLPNGGLRVVSENSAEYPEERLTKQDIEEQQFEIIGWAFNVQNGLPR